jgi:plasmid maintenance system antidote protein VapI
MTNSTINDEYGQYISPAAAARIIGISKQSIANLIRRGYFKTKTAAGRILLLRDDAEAFIPRPKGRPPKNASAARTPTKTPSEILNTKPTREYVSQAEAARIRSVSQQAIANLISRGRLKSITVAGKTLLLRAEVEAFVAKPKLGRPPKKATGKRAAKSAKAKK